MNKIPYKRFSKDLPSSYHFTLLILFILSLTFVGTIGYEVIEGWGFFDSFYMTVITMSTVGYGEVRTLSWEGRLFTIALIMASLAVGGYAFSTIARFIFEGELMDILEVKRMDKYIAKLKNHIILCGGGRTGKRVAIEFLHSNIPFILIEESENQVKHVLEFGDFPYLLADATEDHTLHMAGIEHARGLVTALSDDKDNVFVVLSARFLNPKLRIVARSVEENNIEKLRKAGADEIVSPNTIGGLRMAYQIIRPSHVTFLDSMLQMQGHNLEIAEFEITEGSHLIGKSLKEAKVAEKTGLLVLMVKRECGEQIFNPGGDFPVKSGDLFFVLASLPQLEKLNAISEGK